MIIGNSLYDNTIFPKKWKNKFVTLQHNIACNLQAQQWFEDLIQVNWFI